MAKIKKLKNTKEVAKKVEELDIYRETRERNGFHYPRQFRTISPKLDEKSVIEFLEGIDTIFESNPLDVYAVAEFARGNGFETTEAATRDLFEHLDKKQVRQIFDILNKTNYLNFVERNMSNSVATPEVIEKIHTAKERYYTTLTTLFTDISLTAEAQERSTEFDKQVEQLGVNNPDRELVRAFSFIGVEIKFENGKWVYDADNTARNHRGIKFGNGEYFKLPENSVKVFIENYLNKPTNERHGIVNPKGLFDMYLETARDTVATKSLTQEDKIITEKQFETLKADFSVDSSNWLAFKSGAISINEEAAHIALATYHKNQLTSDRFDSLSESKGKFWSEASWNEIERNDRIDARAIEKIQEHTEKQYQQYQNALAKLEEVERVATEKYNLAISNLKNELNVAMHEEARQEISEKIEELENRRDAVSLTVDFQVAYIEKEVLSDDIDGKPVDLDQIIQDAMAYQVSKNADGQVTVKVTDDLHSLEDVQDIVENLSTNQIEEIVGEEVVSEEVPSNSVIPPEPVDEINQINTDQVVPNIIPYIVNYQDENGEYKYGNALEKAAILDRATYFFASDAYLGQAYETFKEQNPDKNYQDFIGYLENEGFFKENENNENFLFTRETLEATLKDLETGDSTDFNNIIDNGMSNPCLMAEAITQAIDNTPGMRERFETVSQSERQSIVDDFIRQIESTTDFASAGPDEINNAIRRWFPTYVLLSDNAHLQDFAHIDENDGSEAASCKKTLIEHLNDTQTSRNEMNETLKAENQKIVDTDLKYLTPDKEKETTVEEQNQNPQDVRESQEREEPEIEEIDSLDEETQNTEEEKEYDPTKFIKKLKPYNQKAGIKFLEGLVKSLDGLIKEKKIEENAIKAQEESIRLAAEAEEAKKYRDGSALVQECLVRDFKSINTQALSQEYQESFNIIKNLFLDQTSYMGNMTFGEGPMQVNSGDPSFPYIIKSVPEYVRAAFFNVMTGNVQDVYSPQHRDQINKLVGENGFAHIMRTVQVLSQMGNIAADELHAMTGMRMNKMTLEAYESLEKSLYPERYQTTTNTIDQNNTLDSTAQTIEDPEVVTTSGVSNLSIQEEPTENIVVEEENIYPTIEETTVEPIVNSPDGTQLINEAIKKMFNEIDPIELGFDKNYADAFALMKDIFLGQDPYNRDREFSGIIPLQVQSCDPSKAYSCKSAPEYLQALSFNALTNAEKLGSTTYHKSTLDRIDKKGFNKVLQVVEIFKAVSPEVFSTMQGMTMDNLSPDAINALQSYLGKEYVNNNENVTTYETVTSNNEETTVEEKIEEQPIVEEVKKPTEVVSTFSEAEIREDLHWHIVHKSLKDTFDQLGTISANDPRMQDFLQDINQIMNDFMNENSTKVVRKRADGMGASSLVVPCPDGKNSYNCNTITGYIQSLLYLTSTGAELPKLSPEKEIQYREIVDKTMGTPGYFDKIQKMVKVFEGCSLPLVTTQVSNDKDASFTSAITSQIVDIVKLDMKSGKPLNEVINGNSEVINLISDLSSELNTEGLTENILNNIKYELDAEMFSTMSDEELKDYVSFELNQEASLNSGVVSGSLIVGPLSNTLQTAAVAAIERYKRHPDALDGKFTFNGVVIDISSITNPKEVVTQYLELLDNEKINAEKQSDIDQPLLEGRDEEGMEGGM